MTSFFFGTHQMACMFPLDENIHLCGVDKKIVTHSGRRSQLLLPATRCGHPSSYIGSSVDRSSMTHLPRLDDGTEGHTRECREDQKRRVHLGHGSLARRVSGVAPTAAISSVGARQIGTVSGSCTIRGETPARLELLGNWTQE